MQSIVTVLHNPYLCVHRVKAILNRPVFALSLLVIVAGLLTSNRADAQLVDPTMDIGLKPYDSYQGGDIDDINVVGGALNLHAPLISWPQRGKLRFGLTIRYDNPRYEEFSDGPPCGTPGNPCIDESSFDGLGVQVTPDFEYGTYVQQTIVNNNLLSTYAVVSPDGSSHQLGGGESIDATGFHWDKTNNIITDRDGVQYYLGTTHPSITPGALPMPVSTSSGQIISGVNMVRDPHGNQITLGPNGYTDSVGRLIPNQVPTNDFSECSGVLQISSAMLWELPGSDGQSFPYKLCYVHFNLNFNLLPGVNHLPFQGQVTMLQSIVLPNHTTWTFQYEPNYGFLTSITLPTGGTISYSAGVGLTCNRSAAFPHFYSASYRGRNVDANDGQGPQQWGYTTTSNISPLLTIAATDPMNNTILHAFTALDGVGRCSYYETQTQYYQGSVSAANLIKTDATDYTWKANSNNLGSVAAVINVVPIRVTTTWQLPGGGTLVTKHEKDYDPGFTFTDNWGTQFTGITHGNVTAERQYAYGSTSPGALLKTTTITYKWQTSANYLNANLLNLPNSVITSGSGGNSGETDYSYDENNGSPVGTFGNLTSVTTAAGTTRTVYNSQGMATLQTDAMGYKTSITYQCSGAFPLTIVKPYQSSTTLAETTTYGYDCSLGKATSVKDPNNATTTYLYNDSLGRLTETQYPDGGDVGINYNGDPVPPKVTVTTATGEVAGPIVKSLFYDGLGRTTQTELDSDPSGADSVDTTYDGLGRVSTVSNPHRTSPSSSDGVTRYTYDALGRLTIQTQPDGTSTSPITRQWCYNGITSTGQSNCHTNRSTSAVASWVDYSDETGRDWQRVSDPIGRLVAVMEPDGSANIGVAPSVETNYQYDALDNLTKVSQSGGALTRTFTYDGVSRLVCAANPEIHAATCPTTTSSTYVPGTVAYSYDANSNLQTKISPAPNAPATSTASVSTTYSYDALDRLTAKTYSDGSTPTAHFNYDEPSVTIGNNYWSGPHPVTNGVGRLTSWYVGASEPGLAMKTFTYDAVGRPTQSWQCWGSIECNSTYGTRQNRRVYDLAGNIKLIDNSADAGFQYTYDSAGRVTSMVYSYAYPTLGTKTIISQKSYTPFGQPAVVNNGAYVWTYDKRLRPSAFSNSHIGTVNYSYNLVYQPNGNVQSATESSVGNSWTWNYTYDNLNRLSTAVNSQMAEGCQESYDVFGNRTSQQPYGGSQNACGSSNFSFTGNGTSNNNRIDGYCYDAAGNLLDDGPCPLNGSHKYMYDAENRIASANYGAAVYTYGADGIRTTSQVSGQSTYFVYDYDGSLLTHYSGDQPQPGEQEIWDQGRHIGYIGPVPPGGSGSPFLTYVSTDWLGTERVHTDQAGNQIVTFCNLPFGDHVSNCIVSTSHSGPSDPTFFTGKERDSESGLDYFGARYMGSTMGRFMSPDPLGGHTEDPQTLNKYVYVRNNPLSLTDPTGLDFWLSCQKASSTCASQQVGTDKNGNAVNALVQGTTTDGKFAPTVVTSASLSDSTSGNTAVVNGSGVQVTTGTGTENQQTAQGIFINGTPAANINGDPGSSTWSQFNFRVDSSDMAHGVTSAGEFTFNGTGTSLFSALRSTKGEFEFLGIENSLGSHHPTHPNDLNFRFSTGMLPSLFDSGSSLHLTVPRNTDPNSRPATGGFHVDSATGVAHCFISGVC